MKAYVLTVSDSVSRGTREDVSGPAVASRLAEAGYEIESGIVADDAAAISGRLVEWAPRVDAILTTGGTGIAARDVTPEATRAVIERGIPGIPEWMRSEGMKKTPLAILSRGVAGTLGRCVVVNLPGSPKGARESLDSILHVLPHIIDLLRGNTSHGNSG